MRIAVPDWWMMQGEPMAHARQKLAADLRFEHKVAYNIRLLERVLKKAGFEEIRPIEFSNADGTVQKQRRIVAEEGMIWRSSEYDPRGGVSVIVDAVKRKR